MKYTLRSILNKGEDRLKAAGITEFKVDAWLLLSDTADISRTYYFMHGDDIIEERIASVYLDKISRRSEHEPLQYIEGHAPFMGYDFKVNENVLIPRMDTEVLVEEALNDIEKYHMSRHSMNVGSKGKDIKILDMCTGSGCIIISVCKELECKRAEGIYEFHASDLSVGALEVARENAALLQADIHFHQGNLFENVEGEFDFILSNPPYIRTDTIKGLDSEVREHEPMMALDGTADGLYFYRKIVDESGVHLKDGGYLIFEIGHDQGKDVSGLMENAGFSEVYVKKDLAGLDRVVVGKKRRLHV